MKKIFQFITSRPLLIMILIFGCRTTKFRSRIIATLLLSGGDSKRLHSYKGGKQQLKEKLAVDKLILAISWLSFEI